MYGRFVVERLSIRMSSCLAIDLTFVSVSFIATHDSTAGRLLALMNQGHIELDQSDVLVLDELRPESPLHQLK